MCCGQWAILGLCALRIAAAHGAEGFFQLRPEFDAALRAQSPDEGGPSLPNGFSPGTGLYNPFRPSPEPAPEGPFLSPPMSGVTGTVPWGPQYGRIGPIPYRFGWTPRLDYGYLPSAHTNPDVGGFTAYELDTEFVFTAPVGPDLIFTMAPQFSYHNWDTGSSFSKDLFRFGMNLQLATPGAAPWGYQIAFNPSVNTDFGGPLASEAVNLDSSGMMFFRLNPQWQIVLGAGYLDRVNDIIIPYGGVVYTPDDNWEFRLLFPQGRISRYIGDFLWGSHWLYLGWEYHVESYQITTATTSRNQIQMDDYRLTLGIRSDHPGFTKFIEAGYVFGRDIDFKRAVRGFEITDGFLIRGGIRF